MTLVIDDPLWQEDPQWSTLQLGAGSSTFGRGGCLLMSVTKALHILRGELVSPVVVHDKLMRGGAFVRSNMIMAVACSLVGLRTRAVDWTYPESPTSMHRDLLTSGFAGGGVCIVHVDHDSGRKGGDKEPDHFVLATGMHGGQIECLDPKVGHVSIPLDSMTAEVEWYRFGERDGKRADGSPATPTSIRTYRVRGVRQIWST